MTKNTKERMQPMENSLKAEYKGTVYQIPLVQDKDELGTLVNTKVLPWIQGLKALNQDPENIIGIAVTEYVYSRDESISLQQDKMRKVVEYLGIKGSDADSLVDRRPGLNPTFDNLLSERNEDLDGEIDDQALPFAYRTFVIGPMAVPKEIFEIENGPSLEEDVEFCQFYPDHSMAIDGAKLLELSGYKPEGRVTNSDLIKMLQSVSNELLN